jgi:hypothetical protein
MPDERPVRRECTLPACAAGSRADLVAPVRLKLDATDLARVAGGASYRITHPHACILDAPAKLPGNLARPR